jgi:hypothetical protein
MKYCLSKEVNEKNQMSLVFKGSFLSKINRMRIIGQKIAL